MYFQPGVCWFIYIHIFQKQNIISMMCKVYVLLKHISIQFMLSAIGSQCLFPLLKMKRFPISEPSESEISVMVQLSITQFLMILSKISWMLFFHAQELIIFFSIDSYNLIMDMTNPIPDIHFKILIWGTISKTCSINTDYIHYKKDLAHQREWF